MIANKKKTLKSNGTISAWGLKKVIGLVTTPCQAKVRKTNHIVNVLTNVKGYTLILIQIHLFSCKDKQFLSSMLKGQKLPWFKNILYPSKWEET